MTGLRRCIIEVDHWRPLVQYDQSALGAGDCSIQPLRPLLAATAPAVIGHNDVFPLASLGFMACDRPAIGRLDQPLLDAPVAVIALRIELFVVEKVTDID